MMQKPGAPAARFVSESTAVGRSQGSSSQEAGAAWIVLGLTGWLLVLVAGLDLALTWYPTSFGSPEWEFGTVTAMLSGMPAFAMGLALALAAAMMQRKRWLIGGIAALLALLALLLLAAAFLWATTVPMALTAVPEGSAVATGIKKSVARTAGQSVLYPVVFLWMVVKSWRFSTRL